MPLKLQGSKLHQGLMHKSFNSGTYIYKIKIYKITQTLIGQFKLTQNLSFPNRIDNFYCL